LLNFPDEKNLLDLKSHILSNLWQTESSYLEQAKEFFEMRAYSSSNDYRSCIELAQIYKANNDLENALECVKNAVNTLSPMQAIDNEILTLLRFSVEDLIDSILNVSTYEEFRNASPVNVPYLFEDLDEIFLCTYKLSWVCFLISFNDLFHFFLEKVKDKLEKEDEIEVSYTLLEAFKRSHQNVSRDIIKIANVIGVLYSSQPQQLKIQIMASLILALPEVALVEFSHQIGYLSGLYNISPRILEKVQLLVEGLLEKWVNQLSAGVIQAVNAHFLLLIESAESYPAD
jgi:tetratricopeptide (TPR) repeat protein